ncbi:MAG: type II secretion system protein N [Steroidobacteraceae bacterium]
MAAPARSSWRLIVVAVLVGLGILAVRWPLAWATHWLPNGVTCGRPAGSVWHGRCGQLAARGAQLGAVTWHMRALPLLRATLAGTVDLRTGTERLQGEVELRPGGRLIVQRARGDLTLGAGLLQDTALGLRGRLRAQVGRAVLDDRALIDLVGVFTVRDLVQGATPLGSVEVRFDEPQGDAEPSQGIRGTLRDLGGPLGIEGHVTLTRDAGYVVDGFVTLRADTPPVLARQITFLGTPDAAGRRPFSIAGTY